MTEIDAYSRRIRATAEPDFDHRAREALNDARLQAALTHIKRGFIEKRAKAKAKLPEFDALMQEGARIRAHSVDNLDTLLETFESRVHAAGGHVHWCRSVEEAQRVVLGLCRKAGARSVVKSKSMVTEELDLNDYLIKAGLSVVESDLGEYIIQLRQEKPSHIVAPAIHISADQVADAFRQNHAGDAFPPDRVLDTPPQLMAEARSVLRQKFLQADVGITGANFLVAETGSVVLLTNEGNGDLSRLLPKTHIVVTGLEKVVASLEEVGTLLRLLPRSATGQEITTYSSFINGPRQADECDGPDSLHIVLVDNGRSALLNSEFRDILRCIRCGACMNHCPVYGAIGGHAYRSIYPGPMGAVLSPALQGLEQAGVLADASSLCGRCDSVCPVGIPLTRLLLAWRRRTYGAGKDGTLNRLALTLWRWAAQRPQLYHRLAAAKARGLGWLGREGWLPRIPGLGAWQRSRDFPEPEGRSFQSLWAERESKRPDPGA